MTQSPARYLALDVFRGMTICFMIIVNSPGTWSAMYDPLEHAPWHGFTPTDLIFPSFLFAVGNALAFVMHKYTSAGSAAFWRKTLKRTFIIFLLGFLLYWFPFVTKAEDGSMILSPLSEARIMGVLQRIALCYFFASVILYYGGKKFAIGLGAFLLLAYWGVMYWFGDGSDPYSLTGNAALKLDLLLLGEKHLYGGEGIPFDPEGLLSTLPAIVNVIIGYLAGDYIRKQGNSYQTITHLMMAGSVLIFAALTWDMFFPINKKIWTSSFVFLTCGIDLLILSLLIYVIEIANRRNWTYFFVVFGRNPLFIYVLAELLMSLLYFIPAGESNVRSAIFDLFQSLMPTILASFIFSVVYMLVCWCIGYILDRKNIYIKV